MASDTTQQKPHRRFGKFIFLLIAFAIIILYLVFAPDEDAEFVKTLTAAMDQSQEQEPTLLSKVMPGEWSFVCILGETSKPSYNINDHLKHPYKEKRNVSGGDFVGDDSWALAFYFPKQDEVIVKHGYTGILSPYRLYDGQQECVGDYANAFILKDGNGHLKIFNK